MGRKERRRREEPLWLVWFSIKVVDSTMGKSEFRARGARIFRLCISKIKVWIFLEYVQTAPVGRFLFVF